MNSWVARNLIYRPATIIRGEPVFSLLRRYEATQWWSGSRIAALQEGSLRAILRHAGRNVAFYRQRFETAGIDPSSARPEDLMRLPPLTKTDLVEHSQLLQAPRLPGTTTLKTTGGSTGVAVTLRKNRYATAAEQAASWRSYNWYGIQPGDRQARFWGTPQRAGARLRYGVVDFILNRDRFSAFAFQRPDLHHYFARISTTRPSWVYGYVSMLAEFARFCSEENLPLASIGVRAVVTTSEALTESDRATISRAFGAPVFDEYGCGEVGAILYECERGSKHLMAENLYLEVTPDPTPDEPRAMRILITDLHNRATPLLRYDICDRLVPAPPCTCGRGLPSFSAVFGRAYDFVQTADGTRYHGEFFLYVLEEARQRGFSVQQAQFVQIAPGQLEIHCVLSSSLATTFEDGGAWMSRELERRTAGRLAVSVKRASHIDRERSGKIRLIRSETSTGPVADVGRAPQR